MSQNNDTNFGLQLFLGILTAVIWICQYLTIGPAIEMSQEFITILYILISILISAIFIKKTQYKAFGYTFFYINLGASIWIYLLIGAARGF